jgi:ketosteroid isomerase-like protein
VELHRRLYRAFNARDVEALIALADPGISVESVFGAVSGGSYHGSEGIRRWQADLEEAWGSEIRVEVEAYFDLGPRTLAFDVLHGRGERSGVDVAIPGAAVATWSDGRCAEFKAYRDRTEALRDLGLREGELERLPP